MNQNKVPIHPVDSNYIREWLILGPFFPADLDTDFLSDSGGEVDIKPIECDTTIKNGKTLTWERYESKRDVIDFVDIIGDVEDATAYAFCSLQSDADCDAQVEIQTCYGIAIWVNGKQVHYRPGIYGRSYRRDIFEVKLKAGANLCLVKVARTSGNWYFGMKMTMLHPDRAVIWGIISDENGVPSSSAEVRLEHDGEVVAWTRTLPHHPAVSFLYPDEDESASRLTYPPGRYRLNIYPVHGQYDLSAASGNLGTWQLGITLHEGEHRELNITMKEAISIEGRLLMLDGKTPHMAVPIEAVVVSKNNPAGQIVMADFGKRDGTYNFINLKPGMYQVRCQVLGGYVYYGEEKARKSESQKPGMPESEIVEPINLQVEAGKTLRNIDFHFADFKKGTWRSYTSLEGLADDHVFAIHEDTDGMMWFGTRGGISRYDGKEFVNFTVRDGLLHNKVFAIDRDPDGTMWFGTSNGMSRYDGERFLETPAPEEGFENNRVLAVYRDPDAVIWLGTIAGGIYRYDGKEFINLTTKDGLAGNSVWSIGRDANNRMWFGTYGHGISRYDGRGMEGFPHFVNLNEKDGLKPDNFYTIYCDPDELMWFGIYGIAYRYDGKELVEFSRKDGIYGGDLRGPAIKTVYKDPDGMVWFGAEFEGVSRYDGKTFINLGVEDGWAKGVRAIHRSQDGTMWFGTYGSGVWRYSADEFVTFTVRDGLPSDDVRAIQRDPDGAMWIGTKLGLSRYDGKTFDSFPTGIESVVGGEFVNTISVVCREPDGILWFGAEFGGLSRYDGETFTSFRGELPGSNQVNAIHCDCNGVVWIGTGVSAIPGGVMRYDNGGFVNFTAKDGLECHAVLAICDDPDGVVWFGTDTGLFRYDGSRFIRFTIKDGLPDDRVNAIHSDPDGMMWIGTGSGISRYDGRKFANFTTEDGLSHDCIITIHRAADGMLCFGTEGGGVLMYDGISWSSLDMRDGLAGNIVKAIEGDPDGSLWFGTDRGMTRYRRSYILPKARIVSVTTDQTYRDLSAVPAFIAGTRVTIEYSSIDLKTIPEKRQYLCRVCETQDARHKTQDNLESGVSRLESTKYNSPTKDTAFDWFPEDPGTYIFQVQAIDRDLNYSEPASLTLEVIPQPYLEELRQTREELEAAYRELKVSNADLLVAKETAESANQAKSIFLSNMSHEIRTPLNAILGYTQILRRRKNLPADVRDAIETVENSGNHLLALINDVLDISRIEAGRMELQVNDFNLTVLIDGLSNMFQIRCQQKGLTWRVDLETDRDPVLVRGDENKIRQVLINLLSNAVKFTESGGVVLKVSECGHEQTEAESAPYPLTLSRLFRFEVIDTGVGISREDQDSIFSPFAQGKEGAEKGGTGLGLAIAAKHVELMGGKLAVASEMGEGSRFFFTVSLEIVTEEAASYMKEREAQPAPTRLADGHKVLALVADDKEENRDVLSGILSDIGVSVVTAENGQQAVEAVIAHGPDIVFMDIWMPEMDGLEAAQRIISEHGDDCPKLVAVSASVLLHERKQYFDAGFEDFIPKPVDAGRIYRCLASLLHIEYEYEETEITPDGSGIVLPEGLLLRLKEAAQFGHVTELEEALEEIRQMGKAERLLVDQLLKLTQNLDMGAILNILGRIGHD